MCRTNLSFNQGRHEKLSKLNLSMVRPAPNDPSISLGSFSTAYKSEAAEKFEGNAFYVIQSKNGKKVESLSSFQGEATENEILFPAGTQFTVQDIGSNEKGSTVIYLEEV